MRPWAQTLLLLGLAGLGHPVWAQDPDPPAAPEPVEVVGEPSPEAPPDDLSRQHIEQLDKTASAIEALLAGTLPEQRSIEELFTVDLRDEEAVARRVSELQAVMAVSPDPEHEEAQAARRLAAARLRFFGQPPARRAELLAAESERLRIASEGSDVAAAVERSGIAAAAAQQDESQALEEARTAETERERRVASERARVARIKGDLAALEAAQAREHQLTLDRDQAALAQIFALRERAQALPSGGPEAVTVFEQVNTLWLDALARAERVRVPPRVPSYELDAQLMASLDAADPAAAAEFRAAAVSVGGKATAILGQGQEWARAATDASTSHELDLFGVRATIIEKLPSSRRGRLQGLTGEGVSSALAEWRHLKLRARWLVERSARLGVEPTLLRPSLDTGLTWTRGAFYLLPLLAGWWLFRRKTGDWLGQIVAWLGGTPRRAILAAALRRWLDLASPLLPALLDLLAALFVARTLVMLSGAKGLASLLIALFVYRLVVRLTSTLSSRMTGEPEAVLTVVQDSAATVKLLGRYWLLVFVLGTVTEATVGVGTLSAFVGTLTLLGWLTLGFVVVGWWRDPVLDAYLRLRPEGALSDMVRAARGRWYAVFLGFAAFAVVAALALASGVRRFAMGFDQTRRVLAYLFRRRLEKGLGETQLGPLPADLQAKILAAQGPNDAGWVARELGQKALQQVLAEWRVGRTASLIVVGAPGVGKTSWLEAVQQLEERVEQLCPPQRLRSEQDLLRWLGEATGVVADSPAALGDALAAGPRRVLALDDLHLLILRGVEACGAWDALTEVMVASGGRVLWLGAIDSEAWQWLRWRESRRVAAFRAVVELSAWSDAEIARLLKGRVEGLTLRFDALIVGEIEGVDNSAAVVGTQDEFLRLVWDYADGNPAVALSSWLDALSPGATGEELVVHLFHRVSTELLESLSDTERFVLAVLAWHGEISAEDAASSLRFPERDCAEGLRRLRDQGVLAQWGSSFRISSRWITAVRRYLRRKHLLEAE